MRTRSSVTRARLLGGGGGGGERRLTSTQYSSLGEPLVAINSERERAVSLIIIQQWCNMVHEGVK